MITKIFVDLDGVIADFFSAIRVRFDLPADFCTEGRGFIPTFEQWNSIETVEFWQSVMPMEDANEILTVCEDLVGHFRVRILTSISPQLRPVLAQRKLEWIRHWFPNFLYSTIVTGDKSAFAEPTNLLIDDWEYQVLKFRNLGGKAILLPRPWNSEYNMAEWDVVQTLIARIKRIEHNANSD